MTRRDNHNNDRVKQPTWATVAETIEALEHEYGGHVEVSFDREGTRGGSAALWVYAKLYEGWAPAIQPVEHVVRGLWPTAACKEMPSFVFRLLHQLDHAVGAQREAEARGLPF